MPLSEIVVPPRRFHSDDGAVGLFKEGGTHFFFQDFADSFLLMPRVDGDPIQIEGETGHGSGTVDQKTRQIFVVPFGEEHVVFSRMKGPFSENILQDVKFMRSECPSRFCRREAAFHKQVRHAGLPSFDGWRASSTICTTAVSGVKPLSRHCRKNPPSGVMSGLGFTSST